MPRVVYNEFTFIRRRATAQRESVLLRLKGVSGFKRRIINFQNVFLRRLLKLFCSSIYTLQMVCSYFNT